MGRGTKPGKAKVKAQRPGIGARPRKGAASDGRALEQRLAEALERQTATAEILRLISSTPADVQPIFDAIVERAARLCEAEFSAVARVEDGLLHLVAINNMVPGEREAYHSLFPRPPHRGFVIGRAFVEGRPVHVEDVRADPDYDPQTLEVLQRAAPYRTYLGVPILRHGAPIGVIGCGRRDVRPFTDTQIDLVKTFADQAGIAIENARLLNEVTARNRELTDALEREEATAEVLAIVSRSPADVQPVFDAIARSAARLCEGDRADLFRYDGALIHHVTMLESTSAATEEFLRIYPRPADRQSIPGWAILDRAVYHFPDVEHDPRLSPAMLHRVRLLGIRALVIMPMLRDGDPVGAIGVTRREPGPFSDFQLVLLRTFADQAVIALENARRLDQLRARNAELGESLDRQTAMADILRVISDSPTDIQPVLDTIARSARQLCDAQFCFVFRFDDDLLHFVAQHGLSPATHEAVRRAWPRPPDPGTAGGRSILGRGVAHIPDVQADPSYVLGEVAEVASYRSTVAVPMLREGLPIGTINVCRSQAGPFTDRQIDLLRTFADQAVIAVENVRLFTEVQARNRELTESLEQQTATSEVLKVISRSAFDLQPVLESVIESATRLCGATRGHIFRFDGEILRFAAAYGAWPEFLTHLERNPVHLGPGSVAGRAGAERRLIHVHDVLAEEGYEYRELIKQQEYRTALAVPMLRDDTLLGVIVILKSRVAPFTDKQIELVTTFADQAVIAVENARLFKELETRNRDLIATLEQQTATSEILRVISGSPTDVQPVFDAIVESAVRLCEAFAGALLRFDGEMLHPGAVHGPGREQILRTWVGFFPYRPGPEVAIGQAILERRVIHVEDVLTLPANPLREATQRAGGYRAFLAVPMLRDDSVVGVIACWRAEPRAFSDRQISLMQTFADQAVIAIENVRLFQELEIRNRDLTETLEQQTATSEILRVISRSPTDVQPVLDTVTESAARLCESFDSAIWRRDGDRLLLVAHHGPILVGTIGKFYLPLVRGTVAGRSVLDGRSVHVADAQTEVYEFPESSENARRMGFRAILSVPLMREGVAIGSIQVRRTAAQLFTERQVALLETFADQAVIAIENVRLFQELETRTRDLTRSVSELQALGEVSQAVSSTLDLATVLDTIVEHAVQLSATEGGLIYEYDEATQTFVIRGSHHLDGDLGDMLRLAPIRLGEGVAGRAAASREPVQVPDILDEAAYDVPRIRAVFAQRGFRSLLGVPLLFEQRVIGVLIVWRREPGGFVPETVRLLQTFAAQSVVAINNARLFREIQRQKDYADALVTTSPVAIVTMDLGGTVVGWNPGAERLFGYPSAEALGRRMDDLVATPGVREEIRANIRQTIAGESIRTLSRRARKDGTLVDVEISSMPVIVDGARVGMIAIYHDITELLRARQEAEAANEAKSAFLATMSHEIRTPMNAVIGMSGLLLNTPLTDEQREYAEIVRQSGDALLTVINDVLDFSKIEAGRLELESQPFDLRDCVESALDLVATRAAEKGLDLAYVIGDGTPPGIEGDVTRLRQVLLNLLSNAVKFTETGEVVLSVGTRPLDGPAGLHELTFAVRDTGIGIPPDRLDRLFQSFSQVDASTTRRYGGTGLGLAISQRLTELMGGRIAVSSEVDRGSEFRFTMRAHAVTAPATGRRDLTGVQPILRGKRALVVDDNATNRRILTAHLDAWGMRSQATGSPAEALGWVRDGERFDVGILDMHMPEMDGVALARAIRERATAEALPLILFTSLGRREARAEEAGFAAYLNKPIKPSQLFDALASVLAEQPVHVRERGAPRRDLDPEMARRHPLRILLAEDNAVNQKVALRLLGQMGYRADVAANGLEAIEAVERQTYDVVLMDVQMPELDGLEASREITRRWPAEGRPRLVAMTANAMQDDRDLCAAAGMDDYVAKPVRVEELVAALERCRARAEAGARSGPAASPSTQPGKPAEPVGAADAAVDRRVLEHLAASMGGPFVAELIDTFREDARELIVDLRRALGEADRDSFRRAAHSLKSTSETLGAVGLAALARDLETLGRTGNLAGAGDRLDRLADQYDLVARALGELRHAFA
jgi:PAS domain S-box-containing protein